MEGIEFEDEQDLGIAIPPLTSTPQQEEKPSFIMKTLEKMGIADKSTANLILLGIAAIFFGISIFMYANLLGDDTPSNRTAEQIQAQLKVIREMQNSEKNEHGE